MLKNLILFSTLMLLFCDLSANTQQPFPISGDFTFLQGVQYSKVTNGPYVILQSDGNFVVYTSARNYIWGLYQYELSTNGKVATLKFENGNLVASDQKGIIWMAMPNSDPSNILMLNWNGALQIVSSDQATVLWSSNGVLVPDDGQPPVLKAPTPLGDDAPLAGSNIYDLQESCEKCKTGLELLKANMYQYPSDPKVNTNGRRAWSEVYTEFQRDNLPSCKAVGNFLNENKGKIFLAKIEASYADFGVSKWEDYFTGSVGIESGGSRIPQYCPGLHRSQFDCIEASRRMLQVSIPGVEKILEILAPLECMPEDGYGHCRIAGPANIHIYGTDKVSVSAMKNVDHIYTTMTKLYKPAYPASNFEGYKVYMTNGETIAELDALTPINTMWTNGTGEMTRDWLRGGTSPSWLWISEQMICKTGVATRNRDGVKDTAVRTFDQVVHEFGHAIDFKFGLRSQIMTLYSKIPNSNPVEDFPWSIQHWFGTPNGNFKPGALTLVSSIFTERQGFTCDNYVPE